METIEHDGSSSTYSSSPSQTETPEQLLTSSSTNRLKIKSGRKRFKETRHPVYRGVRLKSESKWVCQVREPGKKSRIWLGTFATPEMAARAYDAAALALHGDDSPLNFTDSARLIRRAKSTSACDIQEAALEAALAFGPKPYDTKPSSSSTMVCFQIEKGDDNLTTEEAETSFVDEEVLFNMPCFYNSMAEGLVITPPGMKRGFDWSDDSDSNINLSLWRY